MNEYQPSEFELALLEILLEEVEERVQAKIVEEELGIKIKKAS